VQQTLLIRQTLPLGTKKQHTLTLPGAHSARQAQNPGSAALLPEQTAPHPAHTSLQYSAVERLVQSAEPAQSARGRDSGQDSRVTASHTTAASSSVRSGQISCTSPLRSIAT
jgi:hypothetical protein